MTSEANANRPVFRLALIVGALMSSASHAQVTVTDIAGRDVEISAPAKRILLEAPAYYPALSLLSEDAADLVIGVGRHAYEAERELGDKPRLGWIGNSTFSIEKALALQPDLLIATLTSPGQQGTVEAAFARAGIPIIYVDFFEDPVGNTMPSIEIIGRAIGEEERAAEFADFHRHRVSRVTERIDAAQPSQPTLLINSSQPDAPCCGSFASGFISTFFDLLHVNNIAEGVLAGTVGQLSLEYVIESDPDVFVAVDMAPGPHSLFGQPRTLEHGLNSLEKLSLEPGLSGLAAMHDRRVHAIDVTPLRSPLNVLAVELFAKWAHPELFADLDPQETLDEINARFLATPLEGPFWASLDPAGDRPSGEWP